MQVELTEDGDTAVLLILDDGRGVTGSTTEQHGSGLAGLRERVGAVGGRLVTSEPRGGGYALRVEVPLAGAAVGGSVR